MSTTAPDGPPPDMTRMLPVGRACNNDGSCVLCGKSLTFYETKLIFDNGALACVSHWMGDVWAGLARNAVLYSDG